MDKVKARENIKVITEILNRLGIKWWLDAGTCLGAIREKDFISYDTDTDIGVMIKDPSEVWYLARELFRNGFSFICDFGKIENGYEFAWRKWGIKTDFFFHYEKDNIVWNTYWKNKKRIFLEFEKRLFDNLKEIDFLGMRVFVPNPVEEYLTAMYGDWKTPIQKWNWATDPRCINWERSEITKEEASK